MNIGLTRNSYPEKRCIITSSEHNYIYSPYLSISNYFRKLPIVNKKLRDFVFVPFYNPQVDLYHSFNDICITKKKWVVTFETMLPRFLDLVNCHRQMQVNYLYHDIVNQYLRRLVAPNCLAIIAISNSAYKIQMQLLNSYPEVKNSVLKKMSVIYPPQKKLVDEVTITKKYYKPLKLMFVGRDFYLKGGSEIVIAIDELMLEKKIKKEDIELTLVGNLNNRYNFNFGNYQDSKEYCNSIENIIENRSNISYISEIENKKLLDLMKDQHIGLLTTWADTFGYSVLEFQASGCPVISTNVRALPEINNSDIGWVIPVDTNELGEIIIDSYDKKETVRRYIIDNLKLIILKCLSEEETVRQKAVKALDRIEKFHSIAKYNEKLAHIYNQ